MARLKMEWISATVVNNISVVAEALKVNKYPNGFTHGDPFDNNHALLGIFPK